MTRRPRPKTPLRRGRPLCLIAVLTVIALQLGCASSALAGATGQLTGTVTNTSLEPIAGIEVCAYSTSPEPSAEGFGCATTEASGSYAIGGLASGQYEVEFSPPFESKLNYITQYYDGKSSFSEANAVTVTAGSTTPEIDAELREGGQISGTVTSAAGGKAAIAGIEVCATAEDLVSLRCAETELGGAYTIVGLASGQYGVEFFSPLRGELNYVAQYYNDKSSLSAAEKVPVTAGDITPSIDAALVEGGRIAGRVTDASTGGPLSGALVCAHAEGGEVSFRLCDFTNSNGEYAILAVASGSYRVGFVDGREYTAQYYNGKGSLSEAQPVAVLAGSITTGIDAALQPLATAPANTTPPVVSGTPTVGSALLCANGLWTGKPMPAFTQQWLRDGTPIAGANASSYTVQSADAGHSLSCQVVAKNAAGERSATSARVAIPANSPAAPARSLAPVVATIGSKIVAAKGAVSVQITCGNSICRGSVELTVRVVVRHRRGKRTSARRKTVVLAKGSYSLAAGGRATVVLRLTTAGRRRLAHARRHPLPAKLVLSVTGGASTSKSVLVR